MLEALLMNELKLNYFLKVPKRERVDSLSLKIEAPCPPNQTVRVYDCLEADFFLAFVKRLPYIQT